MTEHPPPQVLVVLLCYRSDEESIRSTLEAIPTELLSGEGWSFLAVVDQLTREHAGVIEAWSAAARPRDLVTIVTPIDLGHGGVQKLAFRHALDAGHDLVLVLPVDGQYAPDDLPRLRRAFEETRADVILGSRFLEGDPAAAGMPATIRLGHRVVSGIQNAILGMALRDHHTGLRAYSGALLARVPFETNTNAYHFDVELLLQAVYAGGTITEVPASVAYKPELHRASRTGHAIASLLTTAQFRLHRMGFLCSLKYRNLSREVYADKVEARHSSHASVLRAVAALRPATLLDIGCGPGHVGQRCRALGIEVTGMDRRSPTSAIDFRFVRADLEDLPLPLDPFAHDVVLLLDVIEHLTDPEAFLLSLRNHSTSIRLPPARSTMILTTPNIAFLAVRLSLVLGRFTYGERGILDIDHKRLFTKTSLLRTLRDCGYDVRSVRGLPPPFELVLPGVLGRLFASVANGFAAVWPSLFAFQFQVECSPRPGLAQLLRSSDVTDTRTPGRTPPRDEAPRQPDPVGGPASPS